jgi:hypothetical protein
MDNACFLPILEDFGIFFWPLRLDSYWMAGNPHLLFVARALELGWQIISASLQERLNLWCLCEAT